MSAIGCAAPYCMCVITTGRCAARETMLDVVRVIAAQTAAANGLPSLAKSVLATREDA